jgi:hypothetical protein
MFSIAEVSEASRLPQPVIMQWVSRTWVDGVGWVFTAAQLAEAVERGAQWRSARAASESSTQQGSAEVVVCDGCGAAAVVDAMEWRLWLRVAPPDRAVRADSAPRDYCPDCVAPCPLCAPKTDELCQQCFGARRVSRRGGPRPA